MGFPADAHEDVGLRLRGLLRSIAGAWFATIQDRGLPDDFFFNISVLIL